MLNQFSRTELLLGKDAMEKLADSRVAVFGIGGVGGYTVRHWQEAVRHIAYVLLELQENVHKDGSNAFVPSVVGLIIAGEVIKDLCKK